MKNLVSAAAIAAATLAGGQAAYAGGHLDEITVAYFLESGSTGSASTRAPR